MKRELDKKDWLLILLMLGVFLLTSYATYKYRIVDKLFVKFFYSIGIFIIILGYVFAMYLFLKIGFVLKRPLLKFKEINFIKISGLYLLYLWLLGFASKDILITLPKFGSNINSSIYVLPPLIGFILLYVRNIENFKEKIALKILKINKFLDYSKEVLGGTLITIIIIGRIYHEIFITEIVSGYLMVYAESSFIYALIFCVLDLFLSNYLLYKKS